MHIDERTEAAVQERGVALRSIRHPDALVSVHYRHGAMEVLVVEVSAKGVLAESTLWGAAAWHLVVEGEAIFERGDDRWELLPGESLQLDGDAPYTILNPTPARLRLLSVVIVNGEKADAEALA
jgi:mannose-6-phosphate isomerase-like protein (cupin superfamily)